MVTTYLLRVTSRKKARKPLRYKKVAENKCHYKYCIIIFNEALDTARLR